MNEVLQDEQGVVYDSTRGGINVLYPREFQKKKTKRRKRKEEDLLEKNTLKNTLIY